MPKSKFQYVCMKSNVTTRGPGPSCFYVDGRVQSFSGWTRVRAAVVLQDVVDGSETFRAIQGFCLTCRGQLNLVYDEAQKKKLVCSVCKHPNYGINAAVKNTVHDVGDKNTWWSMTDGTGKFLEEYDTRIVGNKIEVKFKNVVVEERN